MTETAPPATVLPEGTRVEGFRILRRLGRGGFGITYLASELAPELGRTGDEVPLRQVVLKEYFPHGIAERDRSRTVHPAQELDSAVATFDSGLKSFVREARAIARFDHDNIVRIHRVFEANGTAYFSMPYLKGESLSQILKRERSLSEERCRRLILPVIDGLDYAHHQDVLHRDIKPANIMVREDDSRPVLIDFGNARLHTGEETRSARFTDFLAFSPGFAPLEQYARCTEENPHGPYTDVYAMAAVLYQACVGWEPPEATQRASQVYSGRPDALQPASELLRSKPSYGRSFLSAIDWGLELAIQDRPQTMEEFRDALDGRISRRSRRGSMSLPRKTPLDFPLEPATAHPATAAPTAVPIMAQMAPAAGPGSGNTERLPRAGLPPQATRREMSPDAAGVPSRSRYLRWAAALLAPAAILAIAVFAPVHRSARPQAPAAAPQQAQAQVQPSATPASAPAPADDPAARRHREALDAMNQGNAAVAENRRREAVTAYARALELEPELKNDPTLAANLVACLSWASELAEPLIKRYPSPAIVDALSRRSAELGTLRAQRAADLLTALHHPERIDPSYTLSLAIEDYRNAQNCEAKLAVLPRLTALLDPRAIPVLKESLGSGLGAWFKTRCYRKQVRAAIAELGGKDAADQPPPSP